MSTYIAEFGRIYFMSPKPKPSDVAWESDYLDRWAQIDLAASEQQLRRLYRRERLSYPEKTLMHFGFATCFYKRHMHKDNIVASLDACQKQGLNRMFEMFKRDKISRFIFRLGVSYKAVKQPKKALYYFAMAAKLNPANRDAYYASLAATYYDLKLFKPGVFFAEKALTLTNNKEARWAIYGVLSRIYLASKVFPEASKYKLHKRIAKEFPEDAISQNYMLYWCIEREHDLQKALTQCKLVERLLRDRSGVLIRTCSDEDILSLRETNKALYFLVRAVLSERMGNHLRTIGYLKRATRHISDINSEAFSPLSNLLSTTTRTIEFEALLKNGCKGGSFIALHQNMRDTIRLIFHQLVQDPLLMSPNALTTIFWGEFWMAVACDSFFHCRTSLLHSGPRLKPSGTGIKHFTVLLEKTRKLFARAKYNRGLNFVSALTQLAKRSCKTQGNTQTPRTGTENQEVNEIKTAWKHFWIADESQRQHPASSPLEKTLKDFSLVLLGDISSLKSISSDLKASSQRVNELKTILERLAIPAVTKVQAHGTSKTPIDSSLEIYINGKREDHKYTYAEVCARKEKWARKYRFLYDDIGHELYINGKKEGNPPTAGTCKLLMLILERVGRYVSKSQIRECLTQTSYSTAHSMHAVYRTISGIKDYIFPDRGMDIYRISNELSACLIRMPNLPIAQK